MKPVSFLLFVFVLIANAGASQSIGLGTITPNQSALLDITSANKGLLVPRVNLVSLNDGTTIPNPATSLLVYNTNAALAGGAGYFYNSGTAGAPSWTKLVTSASSGWSLTGNAGTDHTVNFIGTTDSKRLHFRVANQPSGWIDYSTSTTFFGYLSGKGYPFGTNSGSTGFGAYVMMDYIGARNTAMGANAMRNTGMYSGFNSAFGFEALYSNVSGQRNVGVGNASLRSNEEGSQNVAVGDSAMAFNTTGSNNTALGAYALKANLTGGSNVALGYFALENATASGNTAIGVNSMRANSSGGSNTAVGTASLNSNLTGIRNVAIGYNSMDANTSGERNTSVGYAALGSNTSGTNNTALGYIASNGTTTGDYNTAIGSWALANNSIGVNNTAIGFEAMKTDNYSSNNIAVGKGALSSQSYTNGNVGWVGNNVAIGVNALFSNQPNSSNAGTVTNGVRNVAVGNYALEANTTGLNSTSVGHETLKNNTTGFWNNAFGMQALLFNTTGSSNVAIGNNAMRSNTDGGDNVAVGIASLTDNTVGTSNTAVGYAALNLNTSGTNNTAIGKGAGSVNNYNNYCTFIGVEADQADGTNYTASTALGYNSRITASSQVRIGNSTTSSIGGYAAWSNLSDGRFKKNINENVKGLDFIMSLRPVTYNLDIDKLAEYMKEDEGKDASGNMVKKTVDPYTRKQREEQSLILHTGFVAQEVEVAATRLGYQFSGIDKPKNSTDVYALKYSEFVVPLVKGMQEQQNEIKTLKEKIEQLEKLVQQLMPGK